MKKIDIYTDWSGEYTASVSGVFYRGTQIYAKDRVFAFSISRANAPQDPSWQIFIKGYEQYPIIALSHKDCGRYTLEGVGVASFFGGILESKSTQNGLVVQGRINTQSYASLPGSALNIPAGIFSGVFNRVLT